MIVSRKLLVALIARRYELVGVLETAKKLFKAAVATGAIGATEATEAIGTEDEVKSMSFIEWFGDDKEYPPLTDQQKETKIELLNVLFELAKLSNVNARFNELQSRCHYLDDSYLSLSF